MAAQAARDMGQDRLAVLQLDREGRAREDLLDGPEQLERGLFRDLRERRPGAVMGAAGGYFCLALKTRMALVYLT
jgi:hypothetical protein